jgi:hypothetical protein
MIANEYMVGEAATLPFFENIVLLLIMICYYHSHAIQISKSLISRQSAIPINLIGNESVAFPPSPLLETIAR